MDQMTGVLEIRDISMPTEYLIYADACNDYNCSTTYKSMGMPLIRYTVYPTPF